MNAKHFYAAAVLISLKNMLEPIFLFSIPVEVINATSLKYVSQVVLA